MLVIFAPIQGALVRRVAFQVRRPEIVTKKTPAELAETSKKTPEELADTSKVVEATTKSEDTATELHEV